jgi:FtsZ-interacting cell division protein ZipA
MKAILIIVVVVAVLVGGLLTLRSSRNTGMPQQDVLERAKQREREQAAKDKSEEER